MFGRGRFGLTRFDVSGSTLDIKIRLTFSDALKGRIGSGIDLIVESMTFSSKLNGDLKGAAAIPTEIIMSDSLSSVVSGVAAYPIAIQFYDVLSGKINAGADYSVTFVFEDALETKGIKSGADIYLTLPLSDKLMADVQGGMDLYFTEFFSDMLSALANVGSLEQIETIINAAIPAGGELRIDSENYTVTLNGENILHLQKNDWINIERGLKNLIVNSGSGGQLEGRLIYTERYL